MSVEPATGWAECTLGDLGLYHNGRGFKKSEWGQDGQPIIRIQNLTDDTKPFNYYDGETDPRVEVDDGDILVSWAATLDVFRWRRGRAVLNQHIFKVESFIDPDFHYLVLRDAIEIIRAQAHGSGMVHVTRDRFLDSQVLLPSIATQRSVVESVRRVFAELDVATARYREALRNVDRFRASLLTAAVDGRLGRARDAEREDARSLLERVLERRRRAWAQNGARKTYKDPETPSESIPDIPAHWTTATIDQLSTDVRYGTSSKCLDAGDVPVLRMGNIGFGEIDYAHLKYLPRDHPDLHRLHLSDGDLLFNRTNSAKLVGKTAVFRHDDGPFSFASYLIRVRLDQDVMPEFVVAFINSPYGRRWMRSAASQQVGQANVNGTKLKRLALPLPPRADQERACAVIKKGSRFADDLERQLCRALEDTRTLERAVLWRAVRGQLGGDGSGDVAELLTAIAARKAAREAAYKKKPKKGGAA